MWRDTRRSSWIKALRRGVAVIGVAHVIDDRLTGLMAVGSVHESRYSIPIQWHMMVTMSLNVRECGRVLPFLDSPCDARKHTPATHYAALAPMTQAIHNRIT